MNKNLEKDELKQIEDLLINLDVGSDEYKKKIFDDLKYKIEKRELYNEIERNEIYMKNKFFKPSRVAILMTSTLVLGTSLIYGDEIISSIINRLQVGNTEIVQYDSSINTDSNSKNNEILSLKEMQEGFKGKLFDKDGNEVLYGEHQDYYTSDGKLITGMGVKDLPNGKHDFIITTDDNDVNSEKINSLEKVKDIANNKIKFPNYMPNGYSFKYATTSFNGDGIDLTYENKLEETIVLLASSTKESTSGVATTEDIKEIYVDDTKVALSGNAVFWELDAVSYQLYFNSNNINNNVNIEEVSKIIKSFN